MDGMLSQDEINALLNSMDTDSSSEETTAASSNENFLSDMEKIPWVKFQILAWVQRQQLCLPLLIRKLILQHLRYRFVTGMIWYLHMTGHVYFTNFL